MKLQKTKWNDLQMLCYHIVIRGRRWTVWLHCWYWKVLWTRLQNLLPSNDEWPVLHALKRLCPSRHQTWKYSAQPAICFETCRLRIFLFLERKGWNRCSPHEIRYLRLHGPLNSKQKLWRCQMRCFCIRRYSFHHVRWKSTVWKGSPKRSLLQTLERQKIWYFLESSFKKKTSQLF